MATAEGKEDSVRTLATFAITVLCCPVIAMAQIASSSGLGCTVIASGGTTCNGPSAPVGKTDRPRLLITEMKLEAGAAFDVRGNARSDYLIEGVNEGSLGL